MRLPKNSAKTNLEPVSKSRIDHAGFANMFATGGTLGWKKRGDLDPAFEAVAFELETSTTASPKYGEVKTGFGYHIMMVEGRK